MESGPSQPPEEQKVPTTGDEEDLGDNPQDKDEKHTALVEQEGEAEVTVQNQKVQVFASDISWKELNIPAEIERNLVDDLGFLKPSKI